MSAALFAMGLAAGWAARAGFGWWRRRRVNVDRLALEMGNFARTRKCERTYRHIDLLPERDDVRFYAQRAIKVLRG